MAAVDSPRARAVEAVAHRGGPRMEVEGVMYSRTSAGALRGELAKPLELAPGTVPLDDVNLEAELRGRVASDPGLVARDLDIDVDHGVVRLSGSVPDSTYAAHLIDLALAVPGVRAVESSMAWVSPAEKAKLLKRSDARATR